MLIGLDGMILPFVERFVKEGKMPTLKKLMKEGSSGSAWSEYPRHPAHWTVIQTAPTRKERGLRHDHPCSGRALDVVHTGFDSRFHKAEYLWQVVTAWERNLSSSSTPEPGRPG